MRTGQCGSHGLQLHTASQRKGQARITAAKQNPEFSEVRLTLSGISESDPRSTSLYFGGHLNSWTRAAESEAGECGTSGGQSR